MNDFGQPCYGKKRGFALTTKINCMATLLPQAPGKSGTKHRAVKIDMTPMVDLGFLLITFFIFTTSLTQPTVTKLTMPKKADSAPPSPVYEKALLTAVLTKNGVYVYEGAFEKALAQSRIWFAAYDAKAGLGERIRQKQKSLEGESRKADLLVLVKPLPSSSYQNLISALDEMLINGVGRYSVVPASDREKAYAGTAKP